MYHTVMGKRSMARRRKVETSSKRIGRIRREKIRYTLSYNMESILSFDEKAHTFIDQALQRAFSCAIRAFYFIYHYFWCWQRTKSSTKEFRWWRIPRATEAFSIYLSTTQFFLSITTSKSSLTCLGDLYKLSHCHNLRSISSPKFFPIFILLEFL